MARKYARKGKVGLGTYQVAEIGVFSLSGMVNETVEVSEFGDEFKHFDFGIGQFGEISFSGHYDPTDTNGQVLLESAWKNKSMLTDLRCYIDNTSYWVPDLTNDSDSGVLLEEYGAIEFDVQGIGTIEFKGKVSGQLVLE